MSTNKNKRKYKCVNVVMLTAANTILNYLDENREVFLPDNPGWDGEFTGTWRGNIETAKTKIGVKATQQHKEATTLMNRYHITFKDDFKMVRSQIKKGYREDPVRYEELLSVLGFSRLWPKAGNNNQNAMLELLYTFDNQTHEQMCAELIGHGVNKNRIENLKAGAVQMHQANVTQETLKGTAPIVTEEMQAELNAIYQTVIDICEAGKNLFSQDAKKKALFTFSRVVAQQTSKGPGGTKDDGTEND